MIILRSTPNNSNLQGKLKKVRVIGKLKQKTGNKKTSKWVGEGSKYHAHFISWTFNKAWLINIQGSTLIELDWKKVKTKKAQLFWNEFNFLDCGTLFFFTFRMFKTWFELLRVKLYRNDLKGNKNYFKLAGCLSYQGFKLRSLLEKDKANKRKIM